MIKYIIRLVLLAITLVAGVKCADQAHSSYLRLVSPNIVQVRGEKGGGTGFLIKGASGSAYIMTNRHVCGLAFDGNKMFIDTGKERYITTIAKIYKGSDLCALYSPYKPFFGTSFRTTLMPPYIGENIYVLGYPLLEPLALAKGEWSAQMYIELLEEENATKENCSGVNQRFVEAPPLMQLFGIYTLCLRKTAVDTSTVSVLPGNSGSPVLDVFGNVVGVVFASVSGLKSYFVTHADLKQFLGEL